MEGVGTTPTKRRKQKDENVLPVIEFDDGFAREESGALHAMVGMDTCFKSIGEAMMMRKEPRHDKVRGFPAIDAANYSWILCTFDQFGLAFVLSNNRSTITIQKDERSRLVEIRIC